MTTTTHRLKGIVIRASAGNYTVFHEGHEVLCSLRGNLKKELVMTESASRAPRVILAKRKRLTNPVAVGTRCGSITPPRIRASLPKWNRVARQ